MQTKRAKQFLLAAHQEKHLLGWLASLDLDDRHMRQVAFLAVELFCELEVLHQEPSRSCLLLQAAALLHDCGYAIDACKHHKHSRDMILKHELPGFSNAERCAIACLARYHRKASPSMNHALFRELDKSLRRSVVRMAALLRIADGLDRSHMTAIGSIRAEIQSDTVQLILVTRYDIGIDIWGAERKKELFEETFSHKIYFVCDDSAHQ